jgi:hypothetical protein
VVQRLFGLLDCDYTHDHANLKKKEGPKLKKNTIDES